MEYAPGGNLAQQISHGMGFSQIVNLANQTLAALVFLHRQGVIHRDIKPANVLCVTPNHYKLADFGVSKGVAPSLSRQGTAEYVAPEVYDQAPYSFPADIVSNSSVSLPRLLLSCLQWSLGVVLLECMNGLPNRHPTMGRKRYQEILSRLEAYYLKCKKYGASTLELTQLVIIAMLQMNADERLSARRCLEDCQRLRTSLAHTTDRDAEIGANTPRKAHSNGSFPPNALDDSEGDEAAAKTSSTARWNGGGMSEAGREPQNFRNEDRATVLDHSKAEESLLGSIPSTPPSVGEEELYDPSRVLPWPSSIVGGKLYDPANVIPWPASIGETLYDPGRTVSSVPSASETETRARSILDTSMNSQRKSDASAEGTEEDGSVTPGRRAPYHPGNEVAAPGRGFFPPSPWVSSPNQVGSGKSEPSRGQRNKPARRSVRGP